MTTRYSSLVTKKNIRNSLLVTRHQIPFSIKMFTSGNRFFSHICTNGFCMIYFKRIFVSCLLFACIPGFAQLSNQAQISMLTCSSGTEIYAAFGHTAIRVCDSASQLDEVYNYGTFDFNTPNFYVKFARGKLNYTLSVTSFERFMDDYVSENRSVWEQVLLLDSAQKSRLYFLLEENHRPENRNYKYDFFLDNCATRVRDIIESGVNQGKLFDTSATEKTFRQCIQPCLAISPWMRLGCNLALGHRTDSKIETRDLAFLPDELEAQLAGIKIDGKPLAAARTTLFEAEEQVIQKSVFTPLFFTLLLLATGLVITVFEFWKKRKFTAFDKILFTICGLIGLLITFLWFFTDHSSTAWNINYLWANPLWFLLLSNAVCRKKNILFFFMILVVAAVILSALPQGFLDPAVYPFAALLLIRLFVNLNRS